MTNSKKSKNNQAPEDIKPGWLNVVRSAQAACKDNGGYAVLTIKVAVKHNEALLWAPPELLKISPKSMADLEFSPEALGLLSAFIDR